ncbi:MAG: cytochrome c maturation protein CcmE, partial [Jiangellaceae bacterium]
LTFRVSDGDQSMQVVSTGPVPQMFRAGQGVVLEGAMGNDGRFHSDTLLVKHDGEYRAPDDVQLPGGN